MSDESTSTTAEGLMPKIAVGLMLGKKIERVHRSDRAC